MNIFNEEKNGKRIISFNITRSCVSVSVRVVRACVCVCVIKLMNGRSALCLHQFIGISVLKKKKKKNVMTRQGSSKYASIHVTRIVFSFIFEWGNQKSNSIEWINRDGMTNHYSISEKHRSIIQKGYKCIVRLHSIIMTVCKWRDLN